MKIFQLTFLLIACYSCIAQKTESYYDFYWKPCPAENASYYSTVEKTDSGWLRHDYYIQARRLQMQALYKDEACDIPNGNCNYYYANGIPSSIGKMIGRKQEGICVSYHYNGMISDSALFHNGEIVSNRFRWHSNGYMSDSIARVNDSMHVQVGWFDDGSPAYAGYLLYGKQTGKWKYFHRNGQLSSTELYKEGKVINAEYFDENAAKLTDTSGVNREAQFKGGETAWKKYLEKKLYWPVSLQFKTSGYVTIGVSFAVDENGKVTDAYVSLPFHESFDKIAMEIINNSPAWQPAISHNRKVKAWRTQPVTFVQPD